MTPVPPLVPATELAKRNSMTLPNESDEYRRARNALLAEEIELRRHISGEDGDDAETERSDA